MADNPLFSESDVRLESNDFDLTTLLGTAVLFTTEAGRPFYPQTLDLVITEGASIGALTISIGTGAGFTNIIAGQALIGMVDSTKWARIMDPPPNTALPSFAGGTQFNARVPVPASGSTLRGRVVLRGMYRG